MYSPSSPGSEVSTLDSSEPDSESSPSVRRTHSVGQSSESIGPTSPAMTTCEQYHQKLFEGLDPLMPLSAASPVRTSRRRGRAKESMPPDPACGGRCGASSQNSTPLGCWLRMFLLSALEGLTRLPLRWKNSGTPSNRLWWVLGRSERRIGEIASGSSLDWRSPTAEEAGPRIETLSAKDGTAPKLGHRIYRSGGPHQSVTLGLQVQIEKAWPTPKQSDGRPKGNGGNRSPMDGLPYAVRDWPTPRESEWKGTGPKGSKSQKYRLEKGYLDATVEEIDGQPDPESLNTSGKNRDWSTPNTNENDGGSNSRRAARRDGREIRGSLNSRWVAQLMGFPSDWCALPTETLSALTGTRLSRRSRKS